ncbi:nonstructural protein 1 [Red-crowned crane parvovirus]|uniref:Nonstructural protein 1 n=1 Tax=Red-crowned crane parvovirus TaxID=2079601 RepID=A0A2K9YN91_9VIRU|nr:nonstructural protein 1 [Red-crowned crane parvovirus]AUW34307.1 nonstructural protein 1 [Red-crowned crane parvovirus]
MCNLIGHRDCAYIAYKRRSSSVASQLLTCSELELAALFGAGSGSTWSLSQFLPNLSAGKMSLPTRGGFTAVFALPDCIQVEKKIFDLRAAANAGYTNPETGEFVCSRMPVDHELQEEYRRFHENPNWDHCESPWLQVQQKLLMSAVRIETSMQPHAKIFWQAEESTSGKIHFHVLFISGFTSKNISWTMKRMRREIVKEASELYHAYCPDIKKAGIWGALNNISAAMLSLNRGYSPKLGKSIPQPVNPYSFARYYMYNEGKRVLYRWATPNLIADGLVTSKLNAPFTMAAAQDDGPDVSVETLRPGDTLPVSYVSTESDWARGSGDTVIQTGVMEKLCMEALRLCRDGCIYNLRDFKIRHPDKFMQFGSRSQGIPKLTQTIQLYVDTIVSESTAWEIAKQVHGDVDVDCLDDNRVVQLCTWQGYSPRYVAHTLLCWLSGNMGKKNTVYFYGPANTGKTMMAESICKMVGIYGNVNHNNGNFPFNDCHGKAVLWWEECTMKEEYVEAAKCLMGGSSVRVDKKGEDSVLIEKTPMVITSNNDIAVVASRNAVSGNHEAAIRARCLRFNFNKWLTSNWGAVTVRDMYQFLSWGETLGSPTLETYLRLNEKYADKLPYNQPKIELCDHCVQQFTFRETLTLCPSCGGWTPKSISGDSTSGYWKGESDQSLYDAVRSEQVCARML